jgi:hypothetical protein
MLLLIIGWSCIVLQTGRSYAAMMNIHRDCRSNNRAQLCCYDENLAGLLFYKQDAAMLLLIIGWSCIVLPTGRSYAAINNWMVMHCTTNRTQLCCYIEYSAELFVLQTGRSYAAINNWMVMHCTTNRAQLCCY